VNADNGLLASTSLISYQKKKKKKKGAQIKRRDPLARWVKFFLYLPLFLLLILSPSAVVHSNRNELERVRERHTHERTEPLVQSPPLKPLQPLHLVRRRSDPDPQPSPLLRVFRIVQSRVSEARWDRRSLVHGSRIGG
jgi:hypothetical protein